MRAVLHREFGPADRLVAADVPSPIAGRGQVLVDVEVASATPSAPPSPPTA
jgi:NADPH:quinone reductase-like Zn-dependent oxidoreductase